MKNRAAPVHSRSSGPYGPRNFLLWMEKLVVPALLVAIAAQSAFATLNNPDYTKPILNPATQKKWVTAIPNPLTPTFTYSPFTATDATTVGLFPSGANCGVPGPTGEDCYAVTIMR